MKTKDAGEWAAFIFFFRGWGMEKAKGGGSDKVQFGI